MAAISRQFQNYADLESLRTKYYRNLYDTGQEEKAAEIKEREGDPMAAIDLYLKSNQPANAAKILLKNERLCSDENLVEKVGLALVQNEIFDMVICFELLQKLP